MSESHEAMLSPAVVLAEMKTNGVTHVISLPDSETNWLYLLIKAEPSLSFIAVSREGLAFPLAAGLRAGGKTPLVLIQNTGMLESGDSLRGWVLGFNIPLVLMVGYRGWTRHGVTLDSAAVYTERFLNAFGINYYLVETNTWSKPTPMLRVFRSHSRKRKLRSDRLPCSSGTNTWRQVSASNDRGVP